MSPIDDELRSLLHSRADGVAPAPDPLGGIQSRARGLRRRRALTSVAGAAAVVVAIAVAVPLLVSGGGNTANPPGGTPTATLASSDAVFDPANPWAARGDTSATSGECACDLLFAQRLADRTVEEFGFTAPDQLTYYRSTTSAGPKVVPTEQPLPVNLHSLIWALAGDDGAHPGRLVVIAAPDSVVDYAADGSSYQQISDVGQAPKGIGLVPIESEDPDDMLRVTEADGSAILSPAPDWTPPSTGTPVNVLDTWVHRGDAPTITAAGVAQAYESQTGKTGGHYRSLYDGTHDGVRFTIGQAWADGDTAARTVEYDTDGSDGNLFLGPATPRDPWVLGAVFTNNGKDVLALLPRPGAGRVGYSPDATRAFTDVAQGRSDLLAIGLVDRSSTATADRVQVHRGDDSVILTETIAKLTCKDAGCG